MNMKEIRELFGIKEPRKGMKDKKKAAEIVEKILKCRKCGAEMHWVEGTNVCVCPACKTKSGQSLSRLLNKKNENFLMDNYESVKR